MCDLQKGNMWKRISAFLFDSILLSIAAVLFAFLLSWIVDYDGHNQKLNACYEKYETQYGVNFQMNMEEYEQMTPVDEAKLQQAYDAMAQDPEALKANALVMQLTIMIASIGILLAYLVTEYTVPMCLGNGQTLGKKIFGLAVMRKEGIRLNGVTLFIRTILGKYTFETMIPLILLTMIFWGNIGIVGPIILAALLVVQLVVPAAGQTRPLIHDLLAGTVVVDFASQMIFETSEELLAYKKKLSQEKAAEMRS